MYLYIQMEEMAAQNREEVERIVQEHQQTLQRLSSFHTAGTCVQLHTYNYTHVHVFVSCCLATKDFIGSYLKTEMVEEVVGWLGKSICMYMSC